ncbi:MAG: DHH family phosphoesterase, partial [Lachnospiraceae bacterium]|nr:DHH family phosphoesterase [Lachnospiraceae bacterium]
MNEQWILHTKQADFSGLSAKYNIPPLLVKLMVNRGVAEDEFGAYLDGGLKDMHDAASMKDLVKAADMLTEFSGRGEYIAIVSDYDCDGIFSGMILYTGLKRIGANPVIYTPDRVAEGYGINRRIIDEIYNRGINYIITCDNGIAAYEEIEYAKNLGMKVIITDHHEVPYIENEGVRSYRIPPADAVCNPKQEDCAYPYKGLCGGGVAYKLIEYIYSNKGIDMSENNILLEYAAIATVADIMELTGENRIIVKEGLKLISNSGSAGIRAIKTVNGLDDRIIVTYHIGFDIGPCFNAAGRIETAKTAFDLLMCEDGDEAVNLAYRLKELNDERKSMTEDAAEQGLAIASSPEYADDRVIVMILKDCHESIAGIVAGRIKDRLCKPVLVFTEVEGGLCKGSGRSIQSYNM